MKYAIPLRLRIFQIIIEIIATALIVLWIYTGTNKYLDFTNFKYQLGRSPFIQNMSDFIAYTLPAGEIALAVLLVFKRTRLLGLYGSFFLMTLFTGYVYIMLHYSFDLPCSCGGVMEKLSWDDHLYFNAAFTAFALIGIVLQTDHRNKVSISTS